MLCQFLVLTGNWQFFCSGGKFSLRPEKKDTGVSLAGARSITTGKKKDTVVCLLGVRFWRLRPEKKKIQSSVWRVVLYVVSVFGSDGKLAVFLL
jgi:hypothetical protein